MQTNRLLDFPSVAFPRDRTMIGDRLRVHRPAATEVRTRQPARRRFSNQHLPKHRGPRDCTSGVSEHPLLLRRLHLSVCRLLVCVLFPTGVPDLDASSPALLH